MDINELGHHPECYQGEKFIGNFTYEDAKKIGWKTKRAGKIAYKSDDPLYPLQKECGILPYFVDELELKEAGVL